VIAAELIPTLRRVIADKLVFTGLVAIARDRSRGEISQGAEFAGEVDV